MGPPIGAFQYTTILVQSLLVHRCLKLTDWFYCIDIGSDSNRVGSAPRWQVCDNLSNPLIAKLLYISAFLIFLSLVTF